MKNIKSMSFTELHKEFGLNLNLKYFDEILTDPELVEIFYRDFKEYRRMYPGRESTYVTLFLSKHSKAINQEAYVFFTLKELLETGGRYVEKSSFDGIIDKCKKALINSDFTHYEVNYDSTEHGNEIKKVTARELVTGKSEIERKSKNRQRLERIEQDIDLMDLFSFASSNDMLEYFGKNDILSNYIFRLGMIKTLGTVIDIPYRKRLELLDDNNSELRRIYERNIDKVKKSDVQDGIYDSIPIYLRKFPDEFDLDIILIIAAYRANYYLENVNLTPEQQKKYVNVLLVAKKYIESQKTGISDFPCEINREKRDTYEYRDVLNACSKISKKGIYLRSADEQKMADTAICEPGSITQMDPDLIGVIEFSIDEYIQMIGAHEGTLAYLAHNNLISKNNLTKILENVDVKQSDFSALVQESQVNKEQVNQYMRRQSSISSELFSAVSQMRLWTSSEKMDYYLQGKIDINILTAMPDEEKKEFSDLLSPKMLVELYRDEKRKDEYARYANAFRVLVLAGKTKEEKDKIGESIINELDLDMDDDNLVRLYQEHLISLEAVESWGGSELITEMMRNAILKPNDVKEICNNRNYDSLFAIMRDRTIPRKNKLAIFYTTFADEDDSLTPEQQESRERAKKVCLKYMRFSDKMVRIASARGTISREGRTSTEEAEKRKEYVLEPINRWTLIKLLDPEYSYEILDQGMMIFHLPNINGGTVILEKMFRKEGPDYGRATKILRMTIEDFEKIKPDLIVSGDIPVARVDSHPKLAGIVDSYWHSPSWGQKIADSVGYKTDIRRSSENIKKIDQEIVRIKESRRLRD